MVACPSVNVEMLVDVMPFLLCFFLHCQIYYEDSDVMKLACQMLVLLFIQEPIRSLRTLIRNQDTALFHRVSPSISRMVTYTMFNLSGAKIYDFTVSARALSLQDAFSLPDAYSLQDGIGDYEFGRGPEIGVFPGACSVASSQNCTASCLDASMMFGDLKIFHNCLIYPAVAELYVNGSLGDAHLADSLGIDNQSQPMSTATNISTTIFTCLSNYCREDKQCTSDLQQLSSFYYKNGNKTGYVGQNDNIRIYLTVPTIFEFNICNYVAPFSFLNADVGGVGVSTNPA